VRTRAVTGGIHWLRPGGVSACGAPIAGNGTPAMGGVTCEACRAAIDFAIELIAARPIAPYGAPRASYPRAPSDWAEGTRPPSGGDE
jgi:hypothetical protein